MHADFHFYFRPELDIFFNDLKEKYHLTRREVEIVKALAFHGENNKNLGIRFKISEKTLKNHMANIFVKTRLNSSRELQALIFRSLFKYRVVASMFQVAQDVREDDSSVQGHKHHRFA